MNVMRTTSGMSLRQRNRKPEFPPPGSLFSKKQQKKNLLPLNNLSFDAMVIKIQRHLPVNVITPNFVQRLQKASMYDKDQLMKIA